MINNLNFNIKRKAPLNLLMIGKILINKMILNTVYPLNFSSVKRNVVHSSIATAPMFL